MAGKIVVAEIVSDATSSNLIKIGSGATLDLAGSAGSINLPTGSVLQVISKSYSINLTSSSTSYVDTGFFFSITPSSTSSKILVLASVNANSNNNAGASSRAKFNIYRDDVSVGTEAEIKSHDFNNTGASISASMSLIHLDSPATTSAVEYEIYGKQVSGNVWELNDNSGSTMTLMEIAG